MSIEKNHAALNKSLSFAARLKTLRKSLGYTQREFGDKIGVVQGFISDIEKGKKFPSDIIINAICGVFGVLEDWLRDGSGEMFPKANESIIARQAIKPMVYDDLAHRIPILRKVTKGFPDDIADTDLVGYLMSSDVPPDCYAVKAHGEFMAPTIRDGDSVIFTSNYELFSGDIVLLANLWGDIIIRRYRRTDDGRIFFTADNTAFKPFQGDISTRVVGKVIDIWRKIKL